MPQDPRSRISVGIDGRQYVRKNAYIDVLGIPTITEAVRTASEMLRRGIMHAMSTSPEDEAQAKQARAERLKAASQQSQAPTSAADRNPVSVYSDAIAKRPRKPAPTDAADRQKDGDSSPVLIVKEKMAGDKGAANSRAWNSVKKAGPSILSKRARPQSSTVGGSERVFQPALKREKRAELEKRQALLHVAAQTRPSTRVRETTNPHANTKALASAKRPVTSQGSEMKPSSSNGAAKAMSSASLQDRAHQKRGPETTAQKLMRSIAKANAASEGQKSQPSKPTSAPKLLQGHKPTKSIGNLRSPGVRKLPASWSQVSSNGIMSTAGRSSTQPRASILRKPGSSSSASRSTSSGMPAGKGKGSKFTLEQLTMLRNRTEGLPPTRPRTQSSTGSEGMIPRPSTTGVLVKYIPGCQVINGVRPNGYTVARDGVVKPVVTFCPKPKLPHKLRQTSAEKMFEVLRDEKKHSESEALAEALRMEQEMYANSPGRLEYRAALITKLREMRK